VSSTWAKIALVVVFVCIGGAFAATEMALVSLRESQLRTLATRGRRGQRVASLASDPNRFLAALQIGVTFAGFLSAAFGAATLADEFAPVLESWGLPHGLSTTVALISITVVISYLSLVLGELAPKRLALQRAERIALVAAPVVDAFARLASPVVWLLSRSTNLVVRLLGGDPKAGREQMTDEEVRLLVAGHASFGNEARELIEEVFEAGDRQLREVMVPRTEVDFLDATMPVYKAVRVVADLPHSRYPVIQGSADEVVGFVHVRDLFGADPSTRLAELARDVAMLPGTKRLLPALSELRRDGLHLAIVVDEYGGTAGIVTLEDLVEELVGDIRDEYDEEQHVARRTGTGNLEVEGLLNLDDFEDEAGFALPEGPYETVAGYVQASLGHIPQVGETVELDGHRITVTETDGRRVARLLVVPRPPERAAPDPQGSGLPE
jgi:putative hemolysin